MREGAKVTADRRHGAARRHSPGPLGDAHPALRAAEEPRHARPAAGLEGRRRLAAVRLHEPEPGDGEQLAAIDADVAERVAAARAGEVGDAAAGRGPQARRDDAVRREVSRPGADGVDGRVQQGAVRRHASDNTGEVEQFEILSEEGVSAGTRRITALTGAKAAEHVQADRGGGRAKRRSCSACRRMEVAEAAAALAAHARELRKQIAAAVARQREAASERSQSDGERRRRRIEQLKHALAETGRLLVGRAARGAAADRGASRRTSRRWKSSSPSERRPGRCRATRCWNRPSRSAA